MEKSDSMMDQSEEQPQILRLTTPMLKSTHGAPFAQDDSFFCYVKICCDVKFGLRAP